MNRRMLQPFAAPAVTNDRHGWRFAFALHSRRARSFTNGPLFIARSPFQEPNRQGAMEKTSAIAALVARAITAHHMLDRAPIVKANHGRWRNDRCVMKGLSSPSSRLVSCGSHVKCAFPRAPLARFLASADSRGTLDGSAFHRDTPALRIPSTDSTCCLDLSSPHSLHTRGKGAR
jgi:hypothetical protein